MPILSQPPRRREASNATRRRGVRPHAGARGNVAGPVGPSLPPCDRPPFPDPVRRLLHRRPLERPTRSQGIRATAKVPKTRSPGDRRLWKVCPHRETPQDLLRIDHAGRPRHPARRAIRSNHEVGVQLSSVAQPVTVDSPLQFQRLDGMSVNRGGSRFDRHLVERRIKDRPCDRRAMAGVGEPFAAGQLHPATGRADDHHLADVAPLRRGHAEVGQQLKGPRADDVATRLVTRELCLVDQCHPGSAPGQDECGDAARWAATDNEDVKARWHHIDPLSLPGPTVRSSHLRRAMLSNVTAIGTDSRSSCSRLSLSATTAWPRSCPWARTADGAGQ